MLDAHYKRFTQFICVEIGSMSDKFVYSFNNLAFWRWIWMIDSCQSNDYYEHQDSESPCERTFPYMLYIYYLTWRSRAKLINNSIIYVIISVSVIWGRLLSVTLNNGNTHAIYWSSYSRITPRDQNTPIIIIINNLWTSADLTWFMSVSITGFTLIMRAFMKRNEIVDLKTRAR